MITTTDMSSRQQQHVDNTCYLMQQAIMYKMATCAPNDIGNHVVTMVTVAWKHGNRGDSLQITNNLPPI